MKDQDDRVRLGTKDSCWCENCGMRRILWPLHQAANSWREVGENWIHSNGLRECM